MHQARFLPDFLTFVSNPLGVGHVNLHGGTILSRFLFQKWYVSGAAC